MPLVNCGTEACIHNSNGICQAGIITLNVESKRKDGCVHCVNCEYEYESKKNK